MTQPHIHTVADQPPTWSPNAAKSTTNIIAIVLDDTGWSDFGCFGSEIETPNIDALAVEGLRYTNFNVTPLCSPTRSCLLTGKNHHSVGMRFLADIDTGYDNSRGRIRPDITTIPAALKDAGYGTYLAGKWHLTPYHEITSAGPFHNWPLAKGFEKFYGMMDGCTDQYHPELYRDNQQTIRPTDDPDYHFSQDIVSEARGWLRQHATYRGDKPFYLQLAFAATHAPLQVPKRYIDKYVERFEKGWDAARDDRLMRQIEMGLVPNGTQLTPRPDNILSWDSLGEDERRLFTRQQATYAGFLEHTDEQIGRLLRELEETGTREDTIVMVFSDNGAVMEGGQVGTVNCLRHFSGMDYPVAEQMAGYADMGDPDWPAHYPMGWGMASNTPFRRFKQFVDLGGVRSPLVVSWPKKMKQVAGEVRDQFVHIVDLAATIAEIGQCGMDDLHGTSIEGTMVSATAPAPRQTQYWEMMGRRAVWHDGWRAVSEHRSGDDYAKDRWQLYHTASDFSESLDLAATNPDRLAGLQRIWHEQAEVHDVFPLDDRGFIELLRFKSPLLNRSALDLRPGSGHLPYCSGITGSHRSMRVTAILDGPLMASAGVLVSSGNHQGGYVAYLSDGHLVFEHRFLGTAMTCKSPERLPHGARRIGFTLTNAKDAGATVRLFVDDDALPPAEIERTSLLLSYWGMDVGQAISTPVSSNPDSCLVLPDDVLKLVRLEFLDDAAGDTDVLAGRE